MRNRRDETARPHAETYCDSTLFPGDAAPVTRTLCCNKSRLELISETEARLSVDNQLVNEQSAIVKPLKDLINSDARHA
jgi:hypothetical protein